MLLVSVFYYSYNDERNNIINVKTQYLIIV